DRNQESDHDGSYAVIEVSVNTARRSPSDEMLRVPGRHDTGIFHHENDGAFRRSRTVKHTLRHDKTLPRVKLDGAALQVDQKVALENEEEFIVIVVFVPVIFALHYAQSND